MELAMLKSRGLLQWYYHVSEIKHVANETPNIHVVTLATNKLAFYKISQVIKLGR